jgi:secondary thiamine-phosphate synthase enzyme
MSNRSAFEQRQKLYFSGGDMKTIVSVTTREKEQMVDVTAQVSKVVAVSGVSEGMATCFVMHTTAGMTINENADPAVVRDILFALDRSVPDKGFRHAEGNSTAHVKSSLMGSSVRIPIDNGRLMLGTWQGIYFCEFDGPRNRRFAVVIEG